MPLLAPLLRRFFHYLYHSFAWAYDLVSGLVSLGHWTDWISVALPYARGHVLELGHGTGHLLRLGREFGLHVTGLDESMQMGRLARRRLIQSGYTQIDLTRGRAQVLPFGWQIFETLIASFPTNYIFDPASLAEARRVLRPGGRLIVLPGAWIIGGSWLERAAAWLFRVTGEAHHPLEGYGESLRKPFEEAGFQVTIQHVRVRSSIVLVILAEKPL
jgi:ubiquinone/menaquinone biosynthesis C-methylase UbiE